MTGDAGKRRSTRVRHGAPWLKLVLVQCLGGCTCQRNISASAVLPVAASILTAVYHMLKQGTVYRDLGADYLVKRDAAGTVAKLARRIKDLGYEVQYQAAA